MARFDVTGLTQTIKTLAEMGEDTGPVADAMLTVAGRLVVEGWKHSALVHGHHDTFSMHDKIKMSRPKTVGGVRAIEVKPTGKDSHGARNAEKAFVLNYGRKGLAASHWAEEAGDNTEAPAIEAMENVFDEWIWTGRLPEENADWADYVLNL